MGIVTGGITGNVSGQVAGVVFSEARGRSGKLNTVRQKVIPTNPQSPGQVVQRTKFTDVIAIVRALGRKQTAKRRPQPTSRILRSDRTRQQPSPD